jgi:hypothetical protein
MTYNSGDSEMERKRDSMRPLMHRTQNREYIACNYGRPACGTAVNLGWAGYYRFSFEIPG